MLGLLILLLIIHILIIVIEKPIQFAIISAVPFVSADALWVTRVDRRGESAMATIPQKIRNPINKLSNSIVKRGGETKQNPHGKINANCAIRLFLKV